MARSDPEFPGLRPFDPGAAPLVARERAKRMGGSPGWGGVIDGFRADPAGASPLLQTLAWGLDHDLLLRWMCLAARLEEVVSARSPLSAALVTAERWVRERQDSLRYEAYRQAQRENFATPGAMAAMATFVSGPSLAPADAPTEAPSPALGRASATSVLMAVGGSETLSANGFERVNLIGLDLARGRDGRAGAREALIGSEPVG